MLESLAREAVLFATPADRKTLQASNYFTFTPGIFQIALRLHVFFNSRVPKS
jgi:hypothetical protein